MHQFSVTPCPKNDSFRPASWLSWRALFLLILLTVLLVGCNSTAPTDPTGSETAEEVAENSTEEAVAEPTLASPTEQAEPAPTDIITSTTRRGPQPAGAGDATFDVPDWNAFAATYTNEIVGFALRYPADWTLIDVAPEVKQNSISYAATLNSWSTDGGSEGIPPGQTKIDIVVGRSDAANHQEAVDQYRSELQNAEFPVEIVDEAEWTLESGLLAQRWTLQTEQRTSYELLVHFDGWRVLLSGLGDQQRFDEVARTLRPLTE